MSEQLNQQIKDLISGRPYYICKRGEQHSDVQSQIGALDGNYTRREDKINEEYLEKEINKLIDQHTKEQITNVLNNLTVVVKENALRYAPSDTFGEVLNAIAEERKKLL